MRQTALPPLADSYRQKIRLEHRARESHTERPDVHPLVVFEHGAGNRIAYNRGLALTSS